jgi:hypothetical protein
MVKCKTKILISSVMLKNATVDIVIVYPLARNSAETIQRNK